VARTARLTGQGAAIAVVVGLLALLVWRVAHQSHGVKVGENAPHFSLPKLDGGGQLSLRSLRGKAVVINFWQSYCVPCKAEARALEEQWKRYRPRGAVFVGIDYYDFPSDARRFLARYGVTYTTLKDRNGLIVDKFGVTGVPETFFVDRRGRLVGEHILGPINHGDNPGRFRRSIEAALRA
jgi:cytochrome c biogenesis protein CcmG, thiol:disulfide interchange protein DsbE